MKHLFICLLLFACLGANAQEYITDLKYNTRLFNAAQQSWHPSHRAAGDTLSLPFIEDFSYTSVYPDPDLWLDRDVYINSTYPVKPPSYGVATFDGLGYNGRPYDTSGAVSIGPADSLTSKPFNLGGLDAEDSVYLSFYYEAQGYGDYPNPGDFLTLEFKDNTEKWNSVWSKDGVSGSTAISDQHFKLVIVPVLDAKYLFNGFQFRFQNFATRSGNNDHWHVDYIRMDSARSRVDTIFRDVAISTLPTSMLKNYQAMPWSQFKEFKAEEKAPSHSIEVKNNYNIAVSTDSRYNADELYSGVPLISTGIETFDIPAESSHTFSRDSLPTFAVNPPKDSAIIKITYIIQPSGDINSRNDTLVKTQGFYNYYAYDDGSAEKAYGVYGRGAELAVGFHLNKADTLRGIQIHFAHIDVNVHKKLFSLVVWKSLTPEEKIHQQDFLKPTYMDSLNGFYTYVLDTSQAIDGDFYVGWLQSDPDLLNVGLDRNTDSHAHLFYNSSGVAGDWNASAVNGSVMIRPMIGARLTYVGINNVAPKPAREILVYPNPVTDQLNLQLAENLTGRYSIMDATGRTILQANGLTPSINVSQLPGGLYVLKIDETRTGQTFITKFIKL